MAGWIDKVPPAVLEQQAGMCYWLGAARMVSDLIDSRCWYERAYALYGDRHDDVGQLLSWAAIVETTFLEWSDFSMPRSWIVVGEQLPSALLELARFDWAEKKLLSAERAQPGYLRDKVAKKLGE